MEKLSFVIPCYNSELTIEGVIDEIHFVMSQKLEYDYEIICINDCSPGNVLEVLKRKARTDLKMTVVDLAKNMGKHSAMLAGYSFVTGDYVVNLDDDGQCPLDKLWDLFEAISRGSDVAYAAYPVKKQSLLKRFGSYVNSIMAEIIIGKPKGLIVSNFSIHRFFVTNEVRKYRNIKPYLLGVVINTTNNFANVSMEQRERVAGCGNYTFRKSLSLWINGFTSFSVIPLRVSSFIGLLTALGGGLYAVYLIIQRLFIRPGMPVGWASNMAVTLLLGGVIMMMLGMLGEYIGRIYINQNNLPQYVIRDVYGLQSKE